MNPKLSGIVHRLRMRRLAGAVRRYAALPNPDEAGFHNELVQNPNEHSNPLVYADWLDDNDRPGMAALIRNHVAQHQYMNEANPDDPFWSRVVHVQSYPHPDAVNGMDSVSVTPQIGGGRWVSLAHRVQGHPHLWFHWMSGMMANDHAENVVRQLRGEGWPVHGDREGATNFLDAAPQPVEQPRQMSRAVRKYAMHAPEDFHAKIAEQPGDATGALVYADWLGENGMPAHERVVRSHAERYETGANVRPESEYAAMTDPAYPWHTAITGQASNPHERGVWYEVPQTIWLSKRVPNSKNVLRWRMNDLSPDDAHSLISQLVSEGGGEAYYGGGVQLDANTSQLFHDLPKVRKFPPHPRLPPPEQLARQYAAYRYAKDKEVAAARRGKSGVLGQIVKEVRKYTSEELDGLSVLVHPNGQVWIDEMDWHDGKAGGEIIKAAQKIVGKDNVTVVNEGGKPPGEGWIEATDEVDKDNPAMKYAAYRAPAGGMIAPPVAHPKLAGLPGQFYTGGEFVSDKSVLPQPMKHAQGDDLKTTPRRKFDLDAIKKKIKARKVKYNPNESANVGTQETPLTVSYSRAVKRYMLNERQAFEDAIDQDPTDSNAHMIYADWLEDNGEHDEAAFRRAMGNWWHAVSGRQDSVSAAIRKPILSGFRGAEAQTKYYDPETKLIAHVPHSFPEGISENLIEFVPHRYSPEWHEMPPHVATQTAIGGNIYGEGSQVGSFQWETYRNMEEAFRRAFMANRKPPEPEQLARAVRRYAEPPEEEPEDARNTLRAEMEKSGLNPRQIHVLWERLIGQRSFGEIAEDPHVAKSDGSPISRQMVALIEKRALHRLGIDAKTLEGLVLAPERAGRAESMRGRAGLTTENIPQEESGYSLRTAAERAEAEYNRMIDDYIQEKSLAISTGRSTEPIDQRVLAVIGADKLAERTAVSRTTAGGETEGGNPPSDAPSIPTSETATPKTGRRRVTRPTAQQLARFVAAALRNGISSQ